MAASNELIRENIATALEAIPTLAHVYRYMEDNVHAPCAILRLEEGSYYMAMNRSSGERTFEITVLANRYPSVESQKILDAMLDAEGANSIPQMLDTADLGIGTDVREVGPFNEYNGRLWSGETYVGFVFNLTVIID